MKSRFFAVTFLYFLCSFVLYAGGLPENFSAPADTPPGFEPIIREGSIVAEAIGKKVTDISPGRTPLIKIEKFLYQRNNPELGDFWGTNLLFFLSAGKQRGFLATSYDRGIPDYIVSGEIVMAGNSSRIYTQLMKREDSSIIASWVNDFTVKYIYDESFSDAESSGLSAWKDVYETDSREKPVRYEFGSGWINRSFHTEEDVDWFTITTAKKGLLSLETCGSSDTLLTLYKKGETERLAEGNDSNSSTSSRIDYLTEAGETYIVSVKEDRSDTGTYSFRASFQEGATMDGADKEPNNSREQASVINYTTGSFKGSFNPARDVDFYRFTIPSGGGTFTVYTEGGMDPILTLFDAKGNALAADDDGNWGYNASIRKYLPEGIIYVRVAEVDGDAGDYTLVFSLTQ